ELGVTSDALELLDVNRGVDVVLDDALGDEDRVLEVVATPRHERDDDVLAEGELAHVAGRAIRDDVADLHAVAGANDGALVVTGALVGALELQQAVDVREGPGFTLGLDDDARRVDRLDDAVALRDETDARVTRDAVLDPRADDRRVRADRRNGLALHVRAHERAVGVIV